MEGAVDILGSAADMPDSSKLYNALCLLRDYVEAYLRSITLDRLANKNMAEWREEFADIVKTHIAALRQNI